MFERGIQDEINSRDVCSSYTSYHKCIESTRIVEAIMGTKEKAKEARVQTKVKVELGTQEKAIFENQAKGD